MPQYVENPDKPVPGGEPFKDFEARLFDELDSVLEECKAKGCCMGVVSHYRVIKMIEGRMAAGWDTRKVDEEVFMSDDTPTGSVSEIRWSDGKWVMDLKGKKPVKVKGKDKGEPEDKTEKDSEMLGRELEIVVATDKGYRLADVPRETIDSLNSDDINSEVEQHECTCGGTCDHCASDVEEEITELCAVDSYEILAGDSSRGILCRLRQFAMQLDERNDNGRMYPLEVGAQAVEDAQTSARTGVMVSEFEHPRPVRVCDADGCAEKFVDNPERKTAVIDEIESPDKNKRVHITRSIRDTPFGRIIHERAKKKLPVPISTRFKMVADSAKSDSHTKVAKRMTIITWDDVKKPAVRGCGAYTVMADSIADPMRDYTDAEIIEGELDIEEAGVAVGDSYFAAASNWIEPEAKPENLQEGLGDPTQLVSNNTSNPEIQPETGGLGETGQNVKAKMDGERGKGSASTELLDGPDDPKADEEPTNMKNILSLQRRFLRELKAGATTPALDAINDEWSKAVVDAWSKPEEFDPGDVAKFVGAYQTIMADAETSGYSGRRSGPYVYMGNELGEDPMGGWGKETKAGKKGEGELTSMNAKDTPEKLHAYTHGDGAPKEPTEEDKERQAFVDSAIQEKKAKDAEKARVDSVTAKFDLCIDGEHPFNKLADDIKSVVREEVLAQAKSDEDVSALIDQKLLLISKVSADSKLQARGMAGHAKGNTVDDPLNPNSATYQGHLDTAQRRSAVVHEDIPGMNIVRKMLTYSDEIVEGYNGAVTDEFANPRDPGVQKVRAYNLKELEPTLRQMVAMQGGRSPLDGWNLGSDSVEDEVEEHLLATLKASLDNVKMLAGADALATTTSVLYNQPTILMYMVVQAFQDMRAAQFVKVFGPGAMMNASARQGGWLDLGEGIGSVFRLPYESYVNPGGYGFQKGTADAGLLTSEGAQIPAGTTEYSWKSFAPIARAIASTMSLEGILQMGRGPLNLSVVTRNLLHMAARKCRTIDTALQNEMYYAAMEYGAVVVTAESYTTGNSYLPDNSVYNASGSITVNLNPTKLADAAVVASTDKFVTYGANVVGAVRLVTGGSATAAPYVGTNGYAPNPIVVPRVVNDINSAGQGTSTTTNPITITAPAAQVPGLFAGGPGGDNQIYNDGSGNAQTYAVDYVNGVLVFNAASGVTGSAGVMTTTVTLTYSYVTNFDYVVATEALATPLIPSGQNLPRYYDAILAQIDKTAAIMGTGTRFVKPDLALMSLYSSHYVTTADIFYKFNSPDGTSLFPDEIGFAQRTGVRLARINAPMLFAEQVQSPTQATTSAILLTRARTSFYAVDTPFFVSPPIYPQGSNPGPIAGQMFFGYERSAIGTIQSQDLSGNVLNPVGRLILLF